ncbi:DNA-formamidopyrimidine glycosylase [Deinococcus maricopensis]|uniref:Formamidopyrimidine-DNA glycosylase n=1 Tax=Deinococcus maricopensis (strain DSM 21211 / LMG 22137 / NRRL B-23946 / LB-34) TaxID=709986 RepID=E8UA84_DEIML|nr:DNA-formamidopyrimidine glycosylase [Deinococcus maricopensis]ADV67973.1 Formamidopyrimidine-DNA glycosylase [Deinococcus maricopensis DSM 21211]
MPELPEVETTRRKLEPLLLGRTIVRIEHDAPDKYRDTHRAHGRVVRDLTRRGKYILARLQDPDGHEDDAELIVHLGMTGGFRYEPGPHTRVTLHTDEGAIYYQDARKFGKWAVVDPGAYASMPTLAGMGPEPLGDDFAVDAFVRAAATCGPVKPWLLSQVPVAGVGNIYADESLWRARIHPAQRRLTLDEATRLHAAIREVMAEAVQAGGSTLSDGTYAQPDGLSGLFQQQHNAYARDGEPCARCGTTITKSVLAQRGTHHCPACQVRRD